MAVDWLTIKTEYINDRSTSFRKLADKHGVNKDTIARKAKTENWVRHRQTQVDTLYAEAMQRATEKTVEAISDEAASKARIRAHIMKLAEGWFEAQVELVEANGKGAIDPTEFRKMVQSYKDMCEIEGPSGDEDGGTGVVMIPEVTSVEPITK